MVRIAARWSAHNPDRRACRPWPVQAHSRGCRGGQCHTVRNAYYSLIILGYECMGFLWSCQTTHKDRLIPAVAVKLPQDIPKQFCCYFEQRSCQTDFRMPHASASLSAAFSSLIRKYSRTAFIIEKTKAYNGIPKTSGRIAISPMTTR